MDNLISKRLAISNMHNKNHMCLVVDGKDRKSLIKGIQGKDRYWL